MMAYPPGGGQSGAYLMQLWRQYLEKYADHEDSSEEQAIVGAYHAAEVLGALTSALDREGRCRRLIEHRIGLFRSGAEQARLFADCLLAATFTIYNHLNTLARQLTAGNRQADELIREVDRNVQANIEFAGQIDRAAVALNASFPLLGLATIALDRPGAVSGLIRQVEQRFIGGAAHAASAEDRLINGLYRLVEMMQLFAALTDEALQDKALQIASRFEEEDHAAGLMPKLRNGFCRLFELGHLVAAHLDALHGRDSH